MKHLVLAMIVGVLVGCSKEQTEESVFDQGRPDVTKPSKPPVKTEVQIEAANKTFAEIKTMAEAGDADAQLVLGLMYSIGEGVEQDLKEAVKWLQKAADQRNAKAQYMLGNMYNKGEGVPQDFKEAVKLYRKAAEKGGAFAQYNLGIGYAKGQGVLLDYVAAYTWANIAIANGIDVKKFKVNKFKELLEKKMTPEQIAKAQELSKEMVKKNPKLINK